MLLVGEGSSKTLIQYHSLGLITDEEETAAAQYYDTWRLLMRRWNRVNQSAYQLRLQYQSQADAATDPAIKQQLIQQAANAFFEVGGQEAITLAQEALTRYQMYMLDKIRRRKEDGNGEGR
jgi:hypothetical protein